MTGADLKTLRESLGLPAQWVADQAGVRLRTAQYWESEGFRVPEDVAARLSDIDRRFDEVAAAAVEEWQTHGRDGEVVLLRYKTDADLWQFRHDMKPLPASSHAALLSRARRKLEAAGASVSIRYMEPTAYLSWLENKEDTELARAEWAAMQQFSPPS